MDAPPGTRVVVSFFGVDADLRARIDDAVAAVLRSAPAPAAIRATAANVPETARLAAAELAALLAPRSLERDKYLGSLAASKDGFVRVSLLAGYPQVRRYGLNRAELLVGLRAAPTLQLDATEALVRLRTAATADAADAEDPGVDQDVGPAMTARTAFLHGGTKVDLTPLPAVAAATTVQRATPSEAPLPASADTPVPQEPAPQEPAQDAEPAQGGADAVPLYDVWTDEVIGDAASEPDADPVDPNSAVSFLGPKSCWNCNSTEHEMRNCPKPRNPILMALNRAAGSVGGGKSHSRLVDELRELSRVRKFQEMYRPGAFSDDLRRALGVGPNDQPAFLGRMAQIGYPPGYTRPRGSSARPDKLVGLEDRSQWRPSTLQVYVDGPPPDTPIPDGPFEEPLPSPPVDKRTWEKLVDYPSLRPDLPIFSARYPPLSMTPPLGFRLPMVPLAASDPWRRDHGHNDRPSRVAPDPRDLYDGRTDFGSNRRESFPPARYDARDDGSRRREYRGDDDDGPRRDSHLTASARPNDDRYDQYRRRDLDDPSRGSGRYDRRDLDDRYERRDLDDRYERRDLDDRYERRDLDDRYERRDLDDRYERRDLDDRYERRDLDDPMWGSDRRGVAAETRPDYSRRMPLPSAGPPLDPSRSEVARYVDPDRPAPHSLLPAPPPPRDYHRRQGSRSYPPPPPPPPDPARVHDERPSDQPGGSPAYKAGEPSAQPPSSKRARTERRSVARHWPPSAEDVDRAEAPAASAQTQLAADDGGDDMDLEAHHSASGAILHVADPDPASAGQASLDRRWQRLNAFLQRKRFVNEIDDTMPVPAGADTAHVPLPQAGSDAAPASALPGADTAHVPLPQAGADAAPASALPVPPDGAPASPLPVPVAETP